MLMRASARASGPPGQAWGPRPKARCSLALSRSTRNSSGSSNRRGSRPAAPLTTMTVVPAGISTPPDRGGGAAEPEVTLDRALHPQDLLHEVRDAGAVLSEQLLQVRTLTDQLERGREEPDGRLLPGGEQVGRHPHHVDHLGRRPVREAGRRQPGQHVVAGLAPPVLDVGRQPLVEEFQGRVAERARPGAARDPGSPGGGRPGAPGGTTRGRTRARRGGRR